MGKKEDSCIRWHKCISAIFEVFQTLWFLSHLYFLSFSIYSNQQKCWLFNLNNYIKNLTNLNHNEPSQIHNSSSIYRYSFFLSRYFLTTDNLFTKSLIHKHSNNNIWFGVGYCRADNLEKREKSLISFIFYAFHIEDRISSYFGGAATKIKE